MPIYQVECQKCGESEDIYRNISERDDLPKHCGKTMRRVIVPTMVYNDIEPYRSMIDGSLIKSRSHHRRHLKENGCIEIGNETRYLKPKPKYEPKGLKESIIQAVNNVTRS